MKTQVGENVLAWLEEASERHLRGNGTDIYQQFMLHIGATDAIRNYEPTDSYWCRIQYLLDGFFTAAERAEICQRLLARAVLTRLPEARRFLAQALAECRLQQLLDEAATSKSESETG